MRTDKQKDTEMAGKQHVLTDLAALLDTFPAWFPIATLDPKFGETNR